MKRSDFILCVLFNVKYYGFSFYSDKKIVCNQEKYSSSAHARTKKKDDCVLCKLLMEDITPLVSQS